MDTAAAYPIAYLLLQQAPLTSRIKEETANIFEGNHFFHQIVVIESKHFFTQANIFEVSTSLAGFPAQLPLPSPFSQACPPLPQILDTALNPL
ncbi:hypothetical protein KCU71_g662, partial [Aureobasidium melanogenum]